MNLSLGADRKKQPTVWMGRPNGERTLKSTQVGFAFGSFFGGMGSPGQEVRMDQSTVFCSFQVSHSIGRSFNEGRRRMNPEEKQLLMVDSTDSTLSPRHVLHGFPRPGVRERKSDLVIGDRESHLLSL